MKLPVRVEEVSLFRESFETAYPPRGFVPFAEHALGNGDCFGLYWPIGKEKEDPIVAEIWHDEWSIKPFYSSLDHFLDLNNEDVPEPDHPEAPLLTDDPKSPFARVEAARELNRRGDVESSVRQLEEVVFDLPEYGTAWALLSIVYRRVGGIEKAVDSALRAMISPPSFGGVHVPKLASWLVRQQRCHEQNQDDPIWIHRRDFRFTFGGEKENSDYDILQEAINIYGERGDSVKAVALMQTYGELMAAETYSFQERYGFDPQTHVQELSELSLSLLGLHFRGFI